MLSKAPLIIKQAFRRIKHEETNSKKKNNVMEVQDHVTVYKQQVFKLIDKRLKVNGHVKKRLVQGVLHVEATYLNINYHMRQMLAKNH
jgi:hypothetical protein